MNARSRQRYHWDGTKIHSGLTSEYDQEFEDLLQKARARKRHAATTEKIEFDEWPIVGEPFIWRPQRAERKTPQQNSFAQAKGRRTLKRTVLFCLLLAGAIACALFTFESTSFLAGDLWASEGKAIAPCGRANSTSNGLLNWRSRQHRTFISTRQNLSRRLEF
jgi:hypothetical protein